MHHPPAQQPSCLQPQTALHAAPRSQVHCTAPSGTRINIVKETWAQACWNYNYSLSPVFRRQRCACVSAGSRISYPGTRVGTTGRKTNKQKAHMQKNPSYALQLTGYQILPRPELGGKQVICSLISFSNKHISTNSSKTQGFMHNISSFFHYMNYYNARVFVPFHNDSVWLLKCTCTAIL